MTKKQLLISIIPFSILPISILTELPYPGTFTDFIINLKNTTVWWLIQALILLVFWMSKHYIFDKRDSQNLKIVQWYILWNILCIFRGMFIAEGYWDWKGLVGNSMALLIPIVAYAATNKIISQSILSFYVKYSLPLFFVFAFLISTDAYGFYLVPVSIFMLFFPLLTRRWKIITGLFTLLVLTIDLGARSNVIKFGIPILLMLIYYFREIISVKILEFVRKLLILTPILFFLLTVSGVFNVFKMDNYIKGDYNESKRDALGQKKTSSLKADTRTFLYVDVLQTAKKYNTWWMGRSPARGNLSASYGEGDMNRRGERLGNEVAILNIFTWTGIIGVILYFFVFYMASYIATNMSNNIFSKILGLYIAFRWLYAWVEDVNNFSMTTVVLWLTIGLCFSTSFRGMTDREVKYWVRGIFDIHYRKRINGTTNRRSTDRSNPNLSQS